MGHGLYALGNHLAVEGLGQADHALDDGQVIPVIEHVTHKTLVDLEQLCGQLFQVGQRRVARPEIVQRKTHAQPGTCVHQA